MTEKTKDTTQTSAKAGGIPVRDMTKIAIFAALMCILGPLSIPIGPVPISLTTLVIYIMVYVLGMKRGVISCVIYILLGLVGLPVFSGFSFGPSKLLGPTGGYIIGYIFVVLIVGAIIDHWPEKYWLHLIGFIVGTAVLYAFGTAWFIYLMKCTLAYAMSVCVVPFIPGDLCKIVLAMLIGSQVRRALIKANLI